MNLFTNLYNDTDEVREWLKEDSEAVKAYLFDHPQENPDSLCLDDISVWLSEHEEEARRYREYHYGRQWSL